MIIPLEQVQAMRQAYATVTHDAYNPLGYQGTEVELRLEAQRILSEAFDPFPIDPRDITITCITMDGEPGDVKLVYRATWDPPMITEVQLRGGRHDGWAYALKYPHNTVTFPPNVGSSEDHYFMSGFDTDTRRFVFDYQEKAA